MDDAVLPPTRRVTTTCHRPVTVLPRAVTERSLEEVADREFEDGRLLVAQLVEREAPLETERAEGREPPDAEARGPAEQTEAAGVEAGAHEIRELGGRSRLAELLLEVPRVARVGEDDAADP